MPSVLEALLDAHLALCGGQPTPGRWELPRNRSPLDRIAEGLYMWLDALRGYYRAAGPYWATINAIAPLTARMSELDVQASDAEVTCRGAARVRAAALEKLRRASAKYADHHASPEWAAARGRKEGLCPRWTRRLPGSKGSETWYPEFTVRNGRYRFQLPPALRYAGMEETVAARMAEFYRKEDACWYEWDSHPEDGEYGNMDHPDHPHQDFREEKARQAQAAADKVKALEKHDRQVTRRLIQHSTDAELDEMLEEGHQGARARRKYADAHSDEIHRRKLAGNTVWRWTEVNRWKPLVGHTRHCMLSAVARVKMPFIPAAPG